MAAKTRLIIFCGFRLFADIISISVIDYQLNCTTKHNHGLTFVEYCDMLVIVKIINQKINQKGSLMGHENSLSQSTQYEAKKKKRKLSKKQKLMGVGATVATGVALFGAGTMVGGSANKVKTPQGLEQVDLSKTEHGQEQFKQILDPNEQSRLVSEGVDAPTPEAALDELFNAMGHDYRILDVYANYGCVLLLLPITNQSQEFLIYNPQQRQRPITTTKPSYDDPQNN